MLAGEPEADHWLLTELWVRPRTSSGHVVVVPPVVLVCTVTGRPRASSTAALARATATWRRCRSVTSASGDEEAEGRRGDHSEEGQRDDDLDQREAVVGRTVFAGVAVRQLHSSIPWVVRGGVLRVLIGRAWSSLDHRYPIGRP